MALTDEEEKRDWYYCPDCKGDGYLEGVEITPSYELPTIKPCATCKGVGFVDPDNKPLPDNYFPDDRLPP